MQRTLLEHIIRTYPEYYHFFGEKEFTWSKIRQLNRNPILFMDVNGDGLKVGNLPEQGYNLVGSAVSGGQRLIVVILDAKTAKERAEEARRLFNWGFHGFEAGAVRRRRNHWRREGLWRRQIRGFAGLGDACRL